MVTKRKGGLLVIGAALAVWLGTNLTSHNAVGQGKPPARIVFPADKSVVEQAVIDVLVEAAPGNSQLQRTATVAGRKAAVTRIAELVNAFRGTLTPGLNKVQLPATQDGKSVLALDTKRRRVAGTDRG